MAGEIDPALIGLEQRVLIGGLVELAARLVERGNPGVAAARQVDGREIKRQAEQVVAQRTGDELVDLVALLPGHAADDGAGSDVGVDDRRAAIVLELQRIEEALDQPDIVSLIARVEAVDRLGQHRVAEPIDHMRELRHDRRVDRRRRTRRAPGTR